MAFRDLTEVLAALGRIDAVETNDPLALVGSEYSERIAISNAPCLMERQNVHRIASSNLRTFGPRQLAMVRCTRNFGTSDRCVAR